MFNLQITLKTTKLHNFYRKPEVFQKLKNTLLSKFLQQMSYSVLLVEISTKLITVTLGLS